MPEAVSLPADTTREQDRASAAERASTLVMAPTTTSEQDRKTASQRRVNLIWETTQAVIAVAITAAMVYCAIEKIDSKEITYAFISIVTMYFIRTNHTKVGGVGGGESMGTR